MIQKNINKSYYIIEGDIHRYNTLQEIYNKLYIDNIDISSVNIIKCSPIKLNNKFINHNSLTSLDWVYLTRKHLVELIKEYNKLNTISQKIYFSCTHNINTSLLGYINRIYPETQREFHSIMQVLFEKIIFYNILDNTNNVLFYKCDGLYYIIINHVKNEILLTAIILKYENSALYIDINDTITPDAKIIENFSKQDHDDIIKLVKLMVQKNE